ncbi:MAG: MotA/TolQ/ExbB proton channel family protein [Candidatus Riflebacteria bacterium HGW-Riflebacteria-2]|jgi:biopolymer transport protein ExbB|nr:MAG: MotA/TolQ/ExbB proton channel family protein [Candidatus Riflebacteria bacterium HGW-Riflebacteria-2]
MQKIFLVDLFVSGGPVMIPIVICSVIALAIVIERLRFYHRNPNNGAAFMKKVKGAFFARNFLDAMKICRSENTPIANVIAAGIDHLDLSKEHLLDVMRQEAMVQVKKYERHLGKLATIASITPLLGLTGTVTGMISSFAVISTVGIGDPTALAGGISEALYTTAAGLMVGIPALVAHNWCEAKSLEFVEQVEIYSLDLANQVATMEVSCEKAVA